jgi:formylglycine-generating enzyme required for sulfatase activity
MKKLLFIVLIAVLGMTACGPTPEELVEQGKNHLENENYTQAMTCFQKAAEKGNAEAEYNIADLYWGGLGVEEDHETAAEWLKKAAENDYPEAQNALAALYYNGMGVPQDFEKAAKWAKKAAAYDMVEAQYMLASLYFAGKGVPQDYNKAAELYLKVEKKGGDLAKEAQGVLAILYLEGFGVPQSDDKAVEMLRKASGLSLAEAQFRLGELYDRGNKELGIASDTEKATKWYRKSAENGNATAQYYVGNAYQRGLGVAKSLTDAKYWWQKAADQGNEKAKEALRSVAKAEKNAKETNKTFTVNGVSFEMIYVKGGTFTMGGTSEQGSDAYDYEKPTHSVTLSDYYIGKFEVTQELWQAVMGNNPSYFKGNILPVEQVSWNDIQDFIRKLNQKTGANFRLPTEAEWEYAARGGNKSKGYKYSGSNTIDNVAWYISNSGSKTHQVGTKSPNELGIYDMSGNVWEWCQDWYGSYSSGSQTNPTGPSSGSRRVLRGGSWYDHAGDCRVSNRGHNNLDRRLDYNGFRLVLVP